MRRGVSQENHTLSLSLYISLSLFLSLSLYLYLYLYLSLSLSLFYPFPFPPIYLISFPFPFQPPILIVQFPLSLFIFLFPPCTFSHMSSLHFHFPLFVSHSVSQMFLTFRIVVRTQEFKTDFRKNRPSSPQKHSEHKLLNTEF